MRRARSRPTDTTYVEDDLLDPGHLRRRRGTSGAARPDVHGLSSPTTPGITLNITPHISEGDLLRLDIKLTRSDFRETLGTRPPPNTTSSEVQTAVTVPDGSTMILGGMVKLNQSKGGRKVPDPGRHPARGRSVPEHQQLGHREQAVRVRQGRDHPTRRDARPGDEGPGRKCPIETGRPSRSTSWSSRQYQDWPGIKPKPVDPPKVLDAQ